MSMDSGDEFFIDGQDEFFSKDSGDEKKTPMDSGDEPRHRVGRGLAETKKRSKTVKTPVTDNFRHDGWLPSWPQKNKNSSGTPRALPCRRWRLGTMAFRETETG